MFLFCTFPPLRPTLLLLLRCALDGSILRLTLTIAALLGLPCGLLSTLLSHPVRDVLPFGLRCFALRPSVRPGYHGWIIRLTWWCYGATVTIPPLRTHFERLAMNVYFE